MAKTKVAVLFGGASSEHDISLKSAAFVIDNIPRDKYDVITIGITKKGRWLYYPGETAAIPTGEWEYDSDCVSAVLSPDPVHKGIITLEDLIEDILGSIQDEYDNEEEEIRRLSDGKFTVDGSAAIEDVEELTGVELSDDDSETIAGFMLSSLGRIPAAGEQPAVEVGGLRFTAVRTDGRRILEVLIEKTDHPET